MAVGQLLEVAQAVRVRHHGRCVISEAANHTHRELVTEERDLLLRDRLPLLGRVLSGLQQSPVKSSRRVVTPSAATRGKGREGGWLDARGHQVGPQC